MVILNKYIIKQTKEKPNNQHTKRKKWLLVLLAMRKDFSQFTELKLHQSSENLESDK